jgi:hypothetical protein
VLAHLQNAADRSPLPEASHLPNAAGIPDAPASEDELLAHLQSMLAGSMNAAHLTFMGTIIN